MTEKKPIKILFFPFRRSRKSPRILPFHGKFFKIKIRKASAIERNSARKTKNRRSGFVFYTGKTCFDRANKAKPCPNSQFSIFIDYSLD